MYFSILGGTNRKNCMIPAYFKVLVSTNFLARLHLRHGSKFDVDRYPKSTVLDEDDYLNP